MRDALEQYVKWVRKHHEHIRHERATEWSLVGPLLTLLGYDVTDPEQCVPQFRVGGRSEPSQQRGNVDFAILHEGRPLILIEVKTAGEKKLERHQPQLASYFDKVKSVKIGILTNGVEWRFFTDFNTQNIMDSEPFVTWEIFGEKHVSDDLAELLSILKKGAYAPKIIQEFIIGLSADERPEVIPKVWQGPRRCEWEPCQKTFVPRTLADMMGGLEWSTRFCSNVCRGRASYARTVKHLP